ncbi:MAG: hypothetical protein GY909_10890 [Oligoflexia bacterium]|nr:hypothetical protein [Oligoflexia bacterium]
MNKKNQKVLFPIITIFIIIFLIEIVGQLSSVSIQIAKYGSATNLKNHIIQNSKKRVLCIGESTTEGGYPKILQKLLDEKNPNEYQVIDSGYQAVSTDFFVKNIKQIYERTKPQKAILMMGINDQFLISKNDNSSSEIGNKTSKNFFDYFYIIRLTKYALGFLNQNSADERFLRLINAKRIEEAISFFIRNHDEMNNKEVILKGIELITDNLDLEEEEELVLEVFEDIIQRFPDERNYRVERLWFYSDIDNKDQVKEEISELEELGGAFQYLGTFAFQALNDPGLSKEYFENALKNEEEFDLESKAVFFILFENDKSKEREINEVISSLSTEDRKVMTPFLKKLTYRAKKELNLSEEYEYFDKNQFSKKTLKNIKSVANFLKSRGVKVYVAQYPLRSVKIFENNDFKNFKIISNQQVFSDVLEKHPYEEVFSDSFGGDFGHMTFKGQEILAKNILINL